MNTLLVNTLIRAYVHVFAHTSTCARERCPGLVVLVLTLNIYSLRITFIYMKTAMENIIKDIITAESALGHVSCQ